MLLNWQKLTTALQVAAAALGIPAAAGGTYSVYRSYFAPPLNCQSLKASLLDALNGSMSPADKHALMKSELDEFRRSCAAADPAAMAVFDPGAPGKPDARPASAPSPTPAGLYDSIPVGSFAAKGGAPAQGWVALDRRDPDHFLQSSFAGYEAGKPPAPDALLTALWPTPVWSSPQKPGLPDMRDSVGRMTAGQCVRLLAYRVAEQGRPWASVETAECAVHAAR